MQKPKPESLNDVEQRRHERVNDRSNRLRVVDWQTTQELGQVSDISLGGFRLISTQLVPRLQNFLIQIEVKMGERYSKVIALEVCATWQKKRASDGLYETGFYFTNLSTDDAQRLQQIIIILTSSDQGRQIPLH